MPRSEGMAMSLAYFLIVYFEFTSFSDTKYVKTTEYIRTAVYPC